MTGLLRELRNETLSSWFDFRGFLRDRREVLRRPSACLPDANLPGPRTSPLKFAIQASAFPTAVLAVTLAAVDVVVPPNPDPRLIEAGRLDSIAALDRAKGEAQRSEAEANSQALGFDPDLVATSPRSALESLLSDTSRLYDSGAVARRRFSTMAESLTAALDQERLLLDSVRDVLDDEEAIVTPVELALRLRAAREKIDVSRRHLTLEFDRQRETNRQIFELHDRADSLLTVQRFQEEATVAQMRAAIGEKILETARLRSHLARKRRAEVRLDGFLGMFSLPLIAISLLMAAVIFGHWHPAPAEQARRLYLYVIPAYAFWVFVAASGASLLLDVGRRSVGLPDAVTLSVKAVLISWAVLITLQASKSIASATNSGRIRTFVDVNMAQLSTVMGLAVALAVVTWPLVHLALAQ